MFNTLGINTAGAGEVGNNIIPEGEYFTKISKTSWSNDRSGNTYFNVSLSTPVGEHVEGICLASTDPSSKRVGYGKKMLNSLGRAVWGTAYKEGTWTDEMARQLLGKTLMMRVSVQKGTPDKDGKPYPDRNRIESLQFITGDAAPASATAPASAAPLGGMTLNVAPAAQQFAAPPAGSPPQMHVAQQQPANAAPSFMAGGFGNAV